MSAASRLREKAERELRKNIEDTFEEARRDIENKIDDFNRKFRAKEAIHLQDVKDGRWTQDQFDSWMKGQVFQGKQWNDKRDQIIRTISESNSIASRMINEQKINLFSFNANYQAYELEHSAGVNFGFSLYDSAAVERLIRSDPQTLPMWKIDEPKDYTWNLHVVNNSLRQGIIQGERLDQIAERLSEGLISKNKNKMLTFAVTGMTGAQNAGRQTRLEEAKKLGIKVKKEWMATLDAHTRITHRTLDGQRVETDKSFIIGGMSIRFPGDPLAPAALVYNCRCTLVGDIADYPSKYERYDNIDGKPIKNMTYGEWERAKGKTQSEEPVVREFNQVGIGLCKTVEEVNDLLNSAKVFRKISDWGDGVYSQADLTGCDLDSAKAIAAAYEQIFSRFPQLKGRLDAPDAYPVGMKDSTYAWCFIRDGGKVQVNPGPERFGNWKKIVQSYEQDVITGWHPEGTTAESIVAHEIGHAIDGLLAREGTLGGVAADGSYRYASSTLKNTIMKRAAKKDPDIAQEMEIDRWLKDNATVMHHVSEYATQNNREWFAECFAEYITSANPRTVASEFGKELEKLMEKLV